ncbi:MAG: SLBB domain-containing protein, partial [Verrucomicrobiota bacterium]
VARRKAKVFYRTDLTPPESPLESPKVDAWYVVSKSGKIRMPGLKEEIGANGLTSVQLAKAVTDAYAKEKIDIKPKITVGDYGKDPNYVPLPVITVAGEVKTPQEVPFRQRMTLLQAINAAGGFLDTANLRRVKLIHPDRKVVIYDLRDIQADGSNNPELLEEDQVIVPQ